MTTPEPGGQGSVAKQEPIRRGAKEKEPHPLSAAAVALALVALGAYVVAGFPAVPFHPDESTSIYMSSDLNALVSGRIADLCYQPGTSPNWPTQVRLGTAGLPREAIGVADFLLGVSSSAVRSDWNWSLSWQENEGAGALPGPRVLFAARLPMALAVVGTLILVFGIGSRLGGRWAGLLAAFAFGSNALILLHGRRAMSEGLLLLASTLAVWAAMSWTNQPAAKGGALGLAGAAKYSGFVVLPVSLASLLLRWGSGGLPGSASGSGAQRDLRSAWGWAATGTALLLACTLLTFGLFNPVAWCHPLETARAALVERASLMIDQTQEILQAIPVEAVLTPKSRIVALINQTFFAPPAFWDIPNYAKQTAGQEQAYLAGVWGGLPRSIALGAGQLFLALLGLAYSLHTLAAPWFGRAHAEEEKQASRRALLLLLLWTGMTVLAILVAVPVQWQRYYVPLLPETSLLEALGLVMLAKIVKAFPQRWAPQGSR